ncbi:L-asparaginase [Aaosphaeria arxii CBS 175.79]|uniref:asparaginase n=1 Tax=Aaosphaeria arxii CBS 175.79 TaxID=1450172 RepID=A0A6A5X5Z5_9PLEO|nr:L-asparaginase [Aaosphaeria arxii CBS 175.79]KAF2008425.1 L-asparaginase [Aaosphaeria arxii CBS 175.79]
MLLRPALFLFLSVLASSSPVFSAPTGPPAPHHFLHPRDGPHYNSSLPNITVLATGGTIAGSAGSNTDLTGYKAGQIGIQILIDAVPEIQNISNVQGVQVANVDSSGITPEILLNLTAQAQMALDDPHCQGIVITHGTDTLEESAFFLDLTLRSEKPIVIVGSMRPATGLSADGPLNLLEAITLAADPRAVGRGTMVVLNDRITSAFYATKTNANWLDTFKAVEQGDLGSFIDAKPNFFYSPAVPVGYHFFNVSQSTSLPKVDIVFGYQALDPEMARSAVGKGAEGLVLAGVGAGGWTSAGLDEIHELIREHGTQVVLSSRTMGGFVKTNGTGNIYGSQDLNPQKARIMLQLALNAGYDSNELTKLFSFSE